MTGQNSVRDVLAATGPIFLDFDGPVTNLFIEGRNQAIADKMRAVIDEMGVSMSPEAADTPDPLLVLRWAYRQTEPKQFRRIEDACIHGEVAAIEATRPTEGAHDFIHACREAERPLVILSNNTPEAIAAYLDRHHLTDLVAGVVGRITGQPELMKPHPALVDQALQLVNTSPTRVAFIGDSLTDLYVARDTGLRFIGFAKNPRRGHELADAGSEAVIDQMQDIADIVRELATSAQPAVQPVLH